MNLTIETALHGIASALRERIAPEVEGGFAAEVTRLAAMLLTISANAVDDAAAVRIWENAALRSLFAETQVLGDSDLAGRLAQAARSHEPGYRLSELDRENARLRRLLVELHAAVEVQDSAPARALDTSIWRLMREVEGRRAPRA